MIFKVGDRVKVIGPVETGDTGTVFHTGVGGTGVRLLKANRDYLFRNDDLSALAFTFAVGDSVKVTAMRDYGKVTKVLGPEYYLVELMDGCSYHIHASDMERVNLPNSPMSGPPLWSRPVVDTHGAYNVSTSFHKGSLKECAHTFKEYFGMNERYQYCTKCDVKKDYI